jgi:hypothetical protein
VRRGFAPGAHTAKGLWREISGTSSGTARTEGLLIVERGPGEGRSRPFLKSGCFQPRVVQDGGRAMPCSLAFEVAIFRRSGHSFEDWSVLRCVQDGVRLIP